MKLDEELIRAMSDLNELVFFRYMNELCKSEFDYRHLETILQTGMKAVIERYESGEYFLADLIVCGDMYKEAMKMIRKIYNSEYPKDYCGRIVIGVMEGDIHDIGKDIVCQTLETEGFEVIDLGIDVSTDKFLEAVLEYEPDIIELSGVMGFSVEHMQKFIDLMKEKGLRDKVAIVAGGSCMDEKTSIIMGADGYTIDPLDNVELCKNIIMNRRKNEK